MNQVLNEVVSKKMTEREDVLKILEKRRLDKIIIPEVTDRNERSSNRRQTEEERIQQETLLKEARDMKMAAELTLMNDGICPICNTEEIHIVLLEMNLPLCCRCKKRLIAKNKKAKEVCWEIYNKKVSIFSS